jgi:hypothetical protein
VTKRILVNLVLILYAMPDIQATTVAEIIFRAWIKRYGCPLEIPSDQGRQYESIFFSRDV